MRLPWDPIASPERTPSRRARKLNVLHAVAQPVQPTEFALAEDSPSARDVLGDAEALGQERGRGRLGGGVAGSS